MKLLKSQKTLKALQRKSANAVGIIRTTIEKLRAANSKIEDVRERNVAKIENLQSENGSLGELRNSNEKIIANFEALLS